MNEFDTARDIIAYAALVLGAILILKSKVKTDNLSDLKQRVEILEKEREYAREQHLENQKAIASLEGQLKTYKDIPLKEIADSLKNLSRSEDHILERLEENARISKEEAESGGMLVKNREDSPLNVKTVE